MQNGTFPWVNPQALSQKGTWPGYQASLTDLFLKKNTINQFGSGISQLAAASSYLEKMSTLGAGGATCPADESPDMLVNPGQHHLAHSNPEKCPHPDVKDKTYPCQICSQHYSSLHPSNQKHVDVPTSCSTRMSSTNNSAQQNKSHEESCSSSHTHSHLQHNPSAGLSLVSHAHQTVSEHGRRNSSSSSSCPTVRQKHPSVNKQFLCPVCHRCFTQKGNLKTHMMIHTGEKPYSCQMCGKSFTQKGNVDTHLKIHTGEKDYNCHSCGKGFTQKGNLKTHVRSVHTKEKPFVCGMCGKSFSQKGNMLTHFRTHNKDDRFPCTLCGKTFSQKGNLKTHMQRHTGQIPARRYGSRRQAGSSKQQHSATTSETLAENNRNRIKSTDDGSSSPAEHSMIGSGPSSHSHQSVHQVRSPTPVVEGEGASPSHSPIKSAHQNVGFSRDSSKVMDSIRNTFPQQPTPAHLQQPEHIRVSSPLGMQFNPTSTSVRSLYPSSGTQMTAAHASTWLSAVGSGAAFMGGNKNRALCASPYENFGLNPYGSFAHSAQHSANSLSRLGLFPPPAFQSAANTSGSSNTENHPKSNNNPSTNNQGQEATPSSSQQGNQSSGSHHQYQTNTSNPDFSQLLE